MTYAPSRPVTTLKTAWTNICKNAGVKGRWHDNRHTLITELAESGAGDETIMDIAGHVSKQMLRHYSHIRMKAKREALEAVVDRRKAAEEELRQENSAMSAATQGVESESLQKSLHRLQNGDQRDSRRRGIMQADKTVAAKNGASQCSELPANTRGFERESLQKSLQSCNSGGHRGVGRGRKSLKLIGSSGRTRTYNPSVNRACVGCGAHVFSLG